jgi:hypothetical protein
MSLPRAVGQSSQVIWLVRNILSPLIVEPRYSFAIASGRAR